MKKLFQFVAPGLILGLGMLATTMSFASVKIVKETGIKTCKTCHTTGKELNDAGKCFKDKKDLKACSIAAPAAPAK